MLYTDGDEEILNLKKERWEPIVDDVLPEGVCVFPYIVFCIFSSSFTLLLGENIDVC